MMHARFFDHAFAPHTHDEMMIGVMQAGVKRFAREGSLNAVGRYGLSINNPGDLHTGERASEAEIAYSSIYLPVSALTQMGLPPGFAFKDAVLEDKEIWLALLRGLREPESRMAVEEAFTRALWLAAERYGQDHRLRDKKTYPAQFSIVVDFMHSHCDQPISLIELANLAGISPRHLIRSFKARFGLTPHRYLIGLRVRKAQELLAHGEPVAEVAVASGFADQAHLSRTFKAIIGTTPASYRSAFQ